jgi:hypothetical protein
MPLFRSPSELRDIPRELAKIVPALGSAIDRFRRDITASAPARTAGQRRAAPTTTRPVAARPRRPAMRRLVMHRRVRTRHQPGVLRRPHTHDAPPLAGQSAIAAAVRRVASAIRARLLNRRTGI